MRECSNTMPSNTNREEHGEWYDCDVSLQPPHRVPLDRITVFDTFSCCYVIGTDATRRECRVLEFNKSNSNTLLYEDSTSYTSADVKDIMARFNGKANTRVIRGIALLGCVRFTKGYYLLLATRRRLVARLGFHRIFEVTDIELISLCAPVTPVAVTVAEASPLLQARTVEDYYRNQFLAVSLKQNFYYSHTYDLTNTLQVNMSVPYSKRKVRNKFVWNEFLLEPFFIPFTARSTPTEGEALLSPAGIGRWMVYLLHGSIVQCPLYCVGRHVRITLIGRVSKNFAGARYLRRGVSSDGHVANHVEVEQIVMDESTLHTHYTRGAFSSYVQVRGSVPLHWFHPPTQLPKPPIKLGVSDLYYTDTQKHFQELIEDYGVPIIIVNLLRQREKRPRESILGNEYRKAVATLMGYTRDNSTEKRKVTDSESEKVMNVKEENKREKEEILLYYEFDIRESARDAWNNTTAIAEESLKKTGFFACHSSGHKAQWQEGVIRSNCVDCIDRTNLAQFFFGLHALGHQLHALGILYSPVDLALSPDVQNLLLRMFLLMGDAIAVQYGGSPQVGAGVLNRGTGWDKIMGIKRLYNNMVSDREKQSALNIFLGRYQPYPNPYSTACNPVMRIPTTAFGAVVTNNNDSRRNSFSNNSNSNSNSNNDNSDSGVAEYLRSSMQNMSVWFDRNDIRVSRVVDLSEIESDYYLQVKSAPSLARPKNSSTWWKEALQRFHHSMCYQNTPLPLLSSPLLSSLSLSVPSVWDSQDKERDEIIRSMCLRERAATMGLDLDNDMDEVITSNTVQEEEVFHLESTTIVNTLVRHMTIIPSPSLSKETTECVYGLMDHGEEKEEEEEECVYHKSEDALIGFVHNHSTFPDEVRASVFHQDIEAVRHMSDDCEPLKDLRRMQLEVLSMYGDPVDWNAEMLIEALTEVEPEVSPPTVNYLRRINVDRNVLLYKLPIDCMEQGELLQRFSDLVRQIPQRGLETSVHFQTAEFDKLVEEMQSVYIGNKDDHNNNDINSNNTNSNTTSNNNNNNNNNNRGNIAFPDATCRLLQPFFKEAVYPTTMATVVRRLLREMTDANSGVPRSDRLRYREKAGPRVPHALVVLQCFTAKELHLWLISESRRLGLTLHEHVEPHEASQAGWKFMLWLAHANLITQIITKPDFGVVVHPPVKASDFTSRTKLFTLPSLEERYILNKRISSRGAELTFTREESAGVALSLLSHSSIIAYTVSLVNLAFGLLSSVQEMTVTAGGDNSKDSSIHTLLERLLTLSTHLVKVNILALQPRDRWCFWVNVFNTLYIHAWLVAPGQRAQDYKSFYTTNGYDIGGYFFSLNDIKNGILRGNKPPPFALLPPFEKEDPRHLFIPIEFGPKIGNEYNDIFEKGNTTTTIRTTLVHRIQRQILLALIDTYLLPNNFENISSYNPRTIFEEEEEEGQIGMDHTVSSMDVPNTSVDPEDSENDIPFDTGDEDLDMQESTHLAKSMLQRASGLSIGATSWFASWFANRSSNKNVTFTHPCIPLTSEVFSEQLNTIEGYVWRLLNHPTQVMVTRNGVQVPHAVLQLLLYPEEFGSSCDEIIRLLQHHSHTNATGTKRNTSTIINISEKNSPFAPRKH
ncbi:putative synaptojanin (N-terminal domain), putative,inositol/phosphatidylinositol phosphatase [Trypanosoma theileri]|uniref:Putative synaptojanin (N-terminal domain), putative,inositol/phosphatidylinositol phosphatase n=1 Tax=Trypanosoma theileri TaxID=67003 RepID=A0A1X0NVL6_9TRYP|nr:putative synaptojanin (N-terminal domain), putative,inositol/phosphatidylinositol phosphatase [Trypanosoma theileri]ORC88754.1 putative synaptojanin (N-terminal domain), putative,inositol/phosphatidylinositol phosphatase [Trypanosoma theileri]